MNDGSSASDIKLLAVASGGGHWEQLMLLRPALERFKVVFATTDLELARREGFTDAEILPDTNRNHPIRTLTCLFHAWRLVLRYRPDFILTTGALPGLMCVIAGRLLGAKTIWIDSVANSERLSGCGQLARCLATRAITQWEHLATPPRMNFDGRLL